jgi:hypothetical protein
VDAEAGAWRERSGAVGLRKLLARKPAEDPLKRLVELGREELASSGRRPFAGVATRDEAAPICLSPVDEKVGLVSEPVAESFVAKSKRAEPSRSRSGYVWISEKSRSKRAGWADMPERF